MEMEQKKHQPGPSSSALQTTTDTQHGVIEPELYFLIAKFLSQGPLRGAAEIIIAELERQQILPTRLDWTGRQHSQTYAELERKYSHISPQHLIEICKRIPAILEKETPACVSGIVSLLGAGSQSLLRTRESIIKPKTLVDHCTRLHAMPLLESKNRHSVNNIVQVLIGRHSSGPIIRRQAISTGFYGKLELLRRTLGHLSAVYCVLFDRSGKYIITGADDLLVKLWSAIDGRLLTTFRGASAEITDIAVNLDNTLLAAGSLDRILRVWDLQSAGPIAVLSGHTGMITSVNFCPSPRGDLKYLVTTSTDGSVAFWQYNTPRGGKTTFAVKPIQYHEKLRPGQAQMICASFSPGGIFLAAGSADHHVRVYLMSEEGGPKRILETEAHSDTVDSIQWAHSGLKFVSGSKDGMAHVWHFESQQWKATKLNMADRLSSCPPPEDEQKKLKVTMVSWDYSDKWIITAVNDFTIKVWNAVTGKLHKVMRGHTDELYVLESHPKDPHVLISAGHDGQMFVWNIFEGTAITSFINHIDGQGHGGVFDAKWSPDGSMIAATDSHGHILMYGFGSGHQRLKMLPKELFFHTDYRPLVRDVNYFVMDEQTQTIPHLMPPPFLVDVDGNPHPPSFQRLVPGRENCTTEQLVPNITMGPEGVEVVDSSNNTVSDIDRLIAVLANRQGPDRVNGIAPTEPPRPQQQPQQQQQPPFIENNNAVPVANRPVVASPRSNSTRGEGVRQSSGNWEREQNFKWIRRTYVQPMRYSRLQSLRQSVYVAGQQEQELYKREMRRRPLMINTSNQASQSNVRSTANGRSRPPARNNRAAAQASAAQPAAVPAYRTRAVREREHHDEDDDDDPDVLASASSAHDDDSNDSTAQEDMLSGSSSSGDSDSSDYSDWVANDQPGQALEPPKRSKRKLVLTRNYSPASPSNDQSVSTNQPTRSQIAAGRKKIPVIENGEIPECYRPPEWLSEVIPRKAPYYPQMGDEVVYFRQGHQRYLEAVRSKNVYKLNNNCEPWTQLDLRDNEVVKIIGIKYEIRPPRLCCLKLALMGNDNSLTGQSFAIKYHDMPDVLDFIVLRQTYDTAVRRLWTPGDRFRCMIDDGWWTGLIESRLPLNQEFPMSLFMCFRIRWDNGEYECMSPWDMEPIDSNRLPAEVGGQVMVTPEELRATLYQPKSEEWPRGDRDATCRRIVAGLEEVMGLAIADPFLVPVDLNTYPMYAFVVEYPIDLTTIKSRFENHFYRRLTSAQFDVRYLATNAEKFNQSNSTIVKHARIITDLCLRIIKDQNEVDVGAVYHQLMDTYVTSDSDADTEAGPSTSRGVSTPASARRSSRIRPTDDWRIKCRELLEMIWLRDDSTPFREPVDLIDHPDYLAAVDTPMDLRTVKEDLLGGNYDSVGDFVKDMRLIFSNSRNYNTNKRSRIYSMTLRLSNLFEDQLKALMGKKTTKRKPTRPAANRRRRKPIADTPANPVASSSSTTQDELSPRYVRNIRRALNIQTNGVSSTHNNHTSSEPMPGPSTSSGRPIRRPQQQSSSQSTNPVASTSSTNRRSRRREDDEDDEVDEDEDGSDSFNTSSSSSDSDGSAGDRPSANKVTKQRKRPNAVFDPSYSDDSGESYNPSSRVSRQRGRDKTTVSETSRRRQQETTGSRSSRPTRTNGRVAKRQKIQNGNNHSEEEEEEEDVGNEPDEDDDDEDVDIEDEMDMGEDDDANDEDYTSRTPKKSNSKKHTKRSKKTNPLESSSDETSKRRSARKPQRYETDHSYYLDPRTANGTHRRRLPLESEPESEEPLRPRRNRPTPNASQSSGTRSPQQHTSRQRNNRRIRSESGSPSHDEPSTSQQSTGSAIFRRSTRHCVSQEESEDDQVLSQLTTTSNNNGFRNRPRRNVDRERNVDPGPGPSTSSAHRLRESSRNVPATSSSSLHPTASSSQSIVNAQTEATRRTQRSQILDDHDYIDPGPQPLRPRRAHTTLSRHQRNADELDTSIRQNHNLPESNHSVVVPILAVPSAPTAASSRLRQRQIPSTSSGISRSEPPNSGVASTSRQPPRNYLQADDDDDSDDSNTDDDKPLRQIVKTSRPASILIDPLAMRRGRNDPHRDASGPSTSRSTRAQKRPYYNEDSDESETLTHKNPQKKPAIHTNSTTTSSKITRQTLKEAYSEDDDDDDDDYGSVVNNHTADSDENQSEDDDDDDGEPSVSVSSRGRVRKITAKARGLFRE